MGRVRVARTAPHSVTPSPFPLFVRVGSPRQPAGLSNPPASPPWTHDGGMVWAVSPSEPSTVFVSCGKLPHIGHGGSRQPHAAGSRRSLTRTKFARLNHEGRHPSTRSEAPRSVNTPKQQDNRPKHTFFHLVPYFTFRYTSRRARDKHHKKTPDPKILGESRGPF